MRSRLRRELKSAERGFTWHEVIWNILTGHLTSMILSSLAGPVLRQFCTPILERRSIPGTALGDC